MRDLPDEIVPPEPSTRNRRGGGPRERFDVHLKTVTPILGGAARTRTCDEGDVVRVPTIRGHLRFWWRALHAHRFSSPDDLYKEEARIWGRAGDDSGGRSSVEVRVKVSRKSGIEGKDPDAPSAYALWPARGQQGQAAAPRRQPGLVFKLSVSAPHEDLEQVRDAVRLWILFGGYGSRTRRGLGALTVCGDAVDDWLPELPELPDEASHECLLRSLDHLFKSSLGDCNQAPAGRIFSVPSTPAGWAPNAVPVIAGASFLVKLSAEIDNTDSGNAWLAALHRLRDFRQGDPGANGTPARRGARGRSNWPEADVLRCLTGRPGLAHVHAPRAAHSPSLPFWPRAGFGLPIGIRFAPRDAHNDQCHPHASVEPGPVQLLWRDNVTEHDRLASPLIVKPLPVRGGPFLPMALWLNRAEPNGEVFARQGGAPLHGSRAPVGGTFGAPLFSPASGKSSLREAFCDWLVNEHKWKKLA